MEEQDAAAEGFFSFPEPASPPASFSDQAAYEGLREFLSAIKYRLLFTIDNIVYHKI